MLKPGIDPEKLYRATFIRQYGLCWCNMALVSFRLFCKNLGHLREFFGQMVYRPPLAKNFPYAYANDCQIVRPALVSGPPNRKKPYNKHLISLVFSVRTVNYGSSFFSIDLFIQQENHKTLYEKYSLLTKLAKCALNIALKLTFSVFLFFFAF